MSVWGRPWSNQLGKTTITGLHMSKWSRFAYLYFTIVSAPLRWWTSLHSHGATCYQPISVKTTGRVQWDLKQAPSLYMNRVKVAHSLMPLTFCAYICRSHRWCKTCSRERRERLYLTPRDSISLCSLCLFMDLSLPHCLTPLPSLLVSPPNGANPLKHIRSKLVI